MEALLIGGTAITPCHPSSPNIWHPESKRLGEVLGKGHGEYARRGISMVPQYQMGNCQDTKSHSQDIPESCQAPITCYLPN